MVDLIVCRNQRIKIFVPERINHVHHHHVKKVPVYIVTKEKPRVMHALPIEDDEFDGALPRGKSQRTRPELYDDSPIRAIYNGDDDGSHSHVHESLYTDDLHATVRPQLQNINVEKRPKIPYVLKHSGDPAVVTSHSNNNYLAQRAAAKHHSRLTFYK
ncbi:Hypothetical protein CINCED_3A004024 [Cinara cedri]|nr:Hypothetical protein CINCED_3A004024 [Cinara cedri]